LLEFRTEFQFDVAGCPLFRTFEKNKIFSSDCKAIFQLKGSIVDDSTTLLKASELVTKLRTILGANFKPHHLQFYSTLFESADLLEFFKQFHSNWAAVEHRITADIQLFSALRALLDAVILVRLDNSSSVTTLTPLKGSTPSSTTCWAPSQSRTRLLNG